MIGVLVIAFGVLGKGKEAWRVPTRRRNEAGRIGVAANRVSAHCAVCHHSQKLRVPVARADTGEWEGLQ